MPLFDLYGREIEPGDEVILLDGSVRPFEVIDTGSILHGKGVRVVKMQCNLTLPLPAEVQGITALIVKKGEKKVASASA